MLGSVNQKNLDVPVNSLPTDSASGDNHLAALSHRELPALDRRVISRIVSL